MDIPRFDKFGINLYHHKIIQQASAVTISVRTWVSAIIFLIIALGVGSIPAISIISTGKLSGGKLVAGIGAIVSFIIAILYAIYREQITFDFGSKYYKLKRGFIWSIKERYGTFSDITAVTIRETRMSGGTRSSAGRRTYISWGIGLEITPKTPTFEIWETSTREQAEFIARTLADAFGCKVVFEKKFNRQILK